MAKTKKTKTLEIDKEEIMEEAVLHHVHHYSENKDSYRELIINGNLYTVCLISNAPEENIDFLATRAMKILSDLKQGGT